MTGSVWPHVEEAIVDRIVQHRSTIVFCNSRRLAERLTGRLNEIYSERLGLELPRPAAGPRSDDGAGRVRPPGAEPVLAKAHHGSVSKEQRAQVEEELKSGILRCVVATSSLELGIDMGAVDLVIQVEAPPSAASGLQRIGRAGHQVGEVSRAALFPKHRGDVLHTAIVTERMLAGQIEAIAIPQNPLDILAQQTVAACALGPGRRRGLVRDAQAQRAVPRAAPLGVRGDARPARRPLPVRRVRRAAAAAHLGPRSRHAHRAAGRAADRRHQRRHDPRPRAVRRLRRGRVAERARRRARRGDGLRVARQRRLHARHDELAHRRDHPRPGQRRSPPSGSRARCRSGTATASAGRPSSARRSAGSRARSRRPTPEKAEARLRDAGLDENATGNLLAYLARAARGHRHAADRPHAHRRARSRRGRRLARHPAFPVRHAGARAVGTGRQRADPRATRRRGIGGRERRRHHRAGPGCRGRAARAPSCSSSTRTSSSRSSPTRSAARRCSPRASASAPRAPCSCRGAIPAGGRPLWQQRQRSAQLLEVARRYPTFPIILETLREVLQDVYDVPALLRITRGIGERRIRLVETRPRSRRRSRATCSSATSARSCTRATRRSPSAGPPRSRSIPALLQRAPRHDSTPTPPQRLGFTYGVPFSYPEIGPSTSPFSLAGQALPCITRRTITPSSTQTRKIEARSPTQATYPSGRMTRRGSSDRTKYRKLPRTNIFGVDRLNPIRPWGDVEVE